MKLAVPSNAVGGSTIEIRVPPKAAPPQNQPPTKSGAPPGFKDVTILLPPNAQPGQQVRVYKMRVTVKLVALNTHAVVDFLSHFN